jgi:hypothetical protein
MNEKTETRVIFKMIDGECIAFLLDCPAYPGYVMSYMHVGQHGEASIEFFRECKLATETEFEDLREELESIGYRLYLREKWIGE